MNEQMEAWLTHAIDQFDKDKFADGDMITHDWLHAFLLIREPKNVTTETMQEYQFLKMRRYEEFRDYLLRERQIALESIRGEGFRIVPPHEQASYAVEKGMRLVSKGFNTSAVLLQNTRMNKLTRQEATRHTDAQVRLDGLQQLVKRQRVNIFSLFEKKAD